MFTVHPLTNSTQSKHKELEYWSTVHEKLLESMSQKGGTKSILGIHSKCKRKYLYPPCIKKVFIRSLSLGKNFVEIVLYSLSQ